MRIVGFLAFVWIITAVLGNSPAASAIEEPAESLPKKVPVQVVLKSATGAPLSGEGFVVFRGAASPSPVIVATKLPAMAETELPAGSQWTLIADFPGYFAASSVLQVPQNGAPAPLLIPVTLRPAGMLTGKLIVAAKEKFPERLDLRFEPTRETPARKQDVTPGSSPCAVSPTGEWRCRVPAGSFDIALHPKEFVPFYFWNRSVKPGETVSLGALKLQRGASVAGWIMREDGTPAESCRVRLEPATAPGRPNDPVLDFMRSVASEAPCQKKGFFQFTAVKPGSYAVVAQEKDARAQMSPVEVWDGAESRLTIPIILRRPADFELTLSPPTDWLGRPWRVEAMRANEYRAGWESPFRSEANEEGRVRLARQSPGRFWITVFDRLGNSVFSDPHVDLSDPSQPYPITIDLLWLEGKVRLGGEPVVATLFFGGRNGAASIKMTSDAKGRFEGPLPKAGNWRVAIESSEPRLQTSVAVDIKPKGDRATVEIELPDTRVYGRVVDPAGRPAPGAEVTLGSTAGALVTDADAKGEFEFRAFPAGTNEVSAERPANGEREVSEAYRFEAAGGSPQGPVVLTLQGNRTLHGRVLGTTGPVLGATISAWPARGGNGMVSRVRSSFDGGFDLKVPKGTQALRAIVSPPGGALKAYEVNVESDSEILFQVETQGGDLVIARDKSELDDGRLLTLWQDDIGVPSGILAEWTEGHGSRFSLQPGEKAHIPQLAPGSYTVCLGAPALVDIDAWKTKAKCASGYLAPGSTLDLQLR